MNVMKIKSNQIMYVFLKRLCEDSLVFETDIYRCFLFALSMSVQTTELTENFIMMLINLYNDL